MKEYIASSAPLHQNNIFSVILSGITYPDTHYHIYRPSSDFSVLEYVISGAGTVIVNNKSHHVSEGDIYLLKRGDCHEYFPDAKNPFHKIWINIEGSLFENLLSAYSLLGKTVIHDIDILPQMKRLLKINTDASLSQEEKNAGSAIGLHEIFQYIHKMSADNAPVGDAQTLKNYIERNYTKPITNRELSELIFRSEAQTIRIFNKAYGTSPYEYTIRCRMEYGKLLLKNSNLRIKEIAIEVGIPDQHYFSKIFKAKTGFTPGKYRKSMTGHIAL